MIFNVTHTVAYRRKKKTLRIITAAKHGAETGSSRACCYFKHTTAVSVLYVGCMGLVLFDVQKRERVCGFIDVTNKIGSDEESTMCARTACMHAYVQFYKTKY